MQADHEEETLPGAASDAAPFIPHDMPQAERAAQRLRERYRRRSFAECQHAVARMYGHAGWQALERAVAAATAPSAFDDDEDETVVLARRARQCDVALVWLAGVDEAAAREAQALDQVLLQVPRSIGQRYDPLYSQRRLDRARYAYHVAYAARAVAEARPTARGARDIPPDDEELELALRVDLLPHALRAWLAHHRPVLERWSGMIGAMRVRQRCATELLDFSFAWGELCLRHAVDIPKALQIYPLALCAQWYAWLTCLEVPALRVDLALLESADSDSAQCKRAQLVVQSAIRDEEARFLLAQPREDLRSLSWSARRQQMHAGHATVRRYMADAAAEHAIKTILAKPSWLALSPA